LRLSPTEVGKAKKHANSSTKKNNKQKYSELYHCSNPFGETTALECARTRHLLILVFFTATLIVFIKQQFAKITINTHEILF